LKNNFNFDSIILDSKIRFTFYRFSRRARYQCKRIVTRFGCLLPRFRRSKKLPKFNKVKIWADNATLPGCSSHLLSKSLGFQYNTLSARDIQSGHINIFGTKTDVRIKNFKEIRKCLSQIELLALEIPTEIIKQYQPINWHCDFFSGYCWDPSVCYLDIEPVMGADIKTPFELSRFQYFAPMMTGNRKNNSLQLLLQMIDWIVSNPKGFGVNWSCTMDVSLRIINWIWILRIFGCELSAYPKAISLIRQSIFDHAQHIERNLDYAIESTHNHYLSDISALIHIGAAFPEFPKSNNWLSLGIQELTSEMFRQVYDDGYAHEASTNYHRLVTELFLTSAILIEKLPERRKRTIVDARWKKPLFCLGPISRDLSLYGVNLTEKYHVLPDNFYQQLIKMVGFISSVTKPNGLAPQFGDNDSGRVSKLYESYDANVCDHRHILAVAGRFFGVPAWVEAGNKFKEEATLLTNEYALCMDPIVPLVTAVGHKYFPDAGIAILSNQKAHLAVTCGQNGKHGRGGHGHNDKLSFEFSLRDRDFIVDGGCPVYTQDIDLRNRYRSTLAHSTIIVENKEQDNWPEGVAGTFKLPEQTSPELTLSSIDNKIFGSHIGFGVKHTRSFILNENSLEIIDLLPLSIPKKIVFQLSPEVSCVFLNYEADIAHGVLQHNAGIQCSIEINNIESPTLERGWFSEGYGNPINSDSIVARLKDNKVSTVFRW
jgi:hypothetical protein